MTAWVWVMTRRYEGRVTDREIAWTEEAAKERARNHMMLHEPPEWEETDDELGYVFYPPNADDTAYRVRQTILHGYPEE